MPIPELDRRIALEVEYRRICRLKAKAIATHMPWLRATVATMQPASIVELGTGYSFSTLALYLGSQECIGPIDIDTWDIRARPNSIRRMLEKPLHPIEAVTYHVEDVRTARIPMCDLLYIDDDHSYKHVAWELEHFSPMAQKYIVMHDTHCKKCPGVANAMHEFMAIHDDWRILWDCPDGSGMTALIKKSD